MGDINELSSKPDIDFDNSNDIDGVKFSKRGLELLQGLIISNNGMTRRNNFVILRKLLSYINMDDYSKDYQSRLKIEFIQKGLEARIDKGLSDPELILASINGSGFIDGKTPFSLDFIKPLNDEHSKEIIDQASAVIRIKDINNMSKDLEKFISSFNKATPMEQAKRINEYQERITPVLRTLSSNQPEEGEEAMVLPDSPDFSGFLGSLYDSSNTEVSTLRTGTQGVNMLLGGGFENQRVYTFLGLAGEGKSMTMLDLGLQVAHNNPEVSVENGKVPVVVYLTMENSSRESFERIFSISEGDKNDNSISKEEFVKGVRDATEYDPANGRNIAVAVKYKSSNSVDTDYLYELTDELNAKGYKPIFMIQDYIASINSSKKCADTYTEHGAIVSEFKNFAVHHNIPLMTAAQLNREASRSIDKGKIMGEGNLIDSAGRENVGDSFKIIYNTDVAMILIKEGDRNGLTYDKLTNSMRPLLGIKCIKNRAHPNVTNRRVILRYKGNSPGLLQDIDGEPTYAFSTEEISNGKQDDSNTAVNIPTKPKYKEVDDITELDKGSNKKLKTTPLDEVETEDGFAPVLGQPAPKKLDDSKPVSINNPFEDEIFSELIAYNHKVDYELYGSDEMIDTNSIFPDNYNFDFSSIIEESSGVSYFDCQKYSAKENGFDKPIPEFIMNPDGTAEFADGSTIEDNYSDTVFYEPITINPIGFYDDELIDPIGFYPGWN